MARSPRGVKHKRYTVPRVDGGFPRKHKWRLDADLTAPAAFHNSRVEAFIEFITWYWRPEGDILLLSPCSNVKPYPLSPLNRKVEATIKRMGAWGKVEWVFVSDLLGPVPYEYAWVSPPCCYEASPSDVPEWWIRYVIDSITRWWDRIKGFFAGVVVFLPKKYMTFVKRIHGDSISVTTLRYDVFYGQKYLESELSKLISILKKS